MESKEFTGRGSTDDLVPSLFRSKDGTALFQTLREQEGTTLFRTPEGGMVLHIESRYQILLPSEMKLEGIVTPPLISTEASTVTVLALLPDQEVDGVMIKSPIIVQLRRIPEGTLAETWLAGVYEYGVGDTDALALQDLIRSLSDYLSVLSKNRDGLGDSAKEELETLGKMIEVKAATS